MSVCSHDTKGTMPHCIQFVIDKEFTRPYTVKNLSFQVLQYHNNISSLHVHVATK